MFQQIVTLKGVKTLSKSEQQLINGGGDGACCKPNASCNINCQFH